MLTISTRRWSLAGWPPSLPTPTAAASGGPDELVTSLLARFPAEREFWDGLRNDYDVRLGVAVFQESWNRGFELRAGTVALISRMGVPLGFDIYFDGEDSG